jgi:hypothetical protein
MAARVMETAKPVRSTTGKTALAQTAEKPETKLAKNKKDTENNFSVSFSAIARENLF